jgi:molybdenum cofactor cytidylyltransferase
MVLAAGASRRLGRPKQLVRLRYEPLVVRAVRLARSLRPLWVGVVVGARAGRVASALAGLDVEVVHARRWREGLSASLAAGVRRAPRRARRLLVMTVDQWQISAADLRRLVAAARGARPAAAAYAGDIGVPAVFPRRLWPALAALRGDRGARQLLVGGAAVAVPMAAAAADLDTPAGLAALRRPPGARRAPGGRP